MKMDGKIKSPTRKKLSLALALGLLAALSIPRTFGASTDVHILGGSFEPDTVTIQVNDDVNWIWDSDFHNTTSSQPGLWASPTANTGFTFSHTFNSTGSFPYSCT